MFRNLIQINLSITMSRVWKLDSLFCNDLKPSTTTFFGVGAINFPIDLCPVRWVHCLVNGHLFGLWKSEYIFSSYTLLVKIPSGLLPYPWITWFRIDCRYQTSIIVIINIQCGFRQTFRSKINPCTPPEINGIKPMRWPRNVWANTVGFASNCIRNRLVY